MANQSQSGYRPRGSADRRGRYRMAVLTWVGDRVATALLHDGQSLDVIVPNGMWVFAGNRVVLVPYPGGWVVAAGVTAQARTLARRQR